MKKLLSIILCCFGVIIFANVITFSNTTQSLTVNSGELLEATVKAKCTGTAYGDSSFYIGLYTIPYGYKDHTINGSLRKGEEKDIKFRFQLTVSETTTYRYEFTAEYYDENGYRHESGKIVFNITYVKESNPDSDGDGLSDNEDRCPNQAGPASNNGCPISDSDGDGIPDDQDNCPNQAGPASNNGCPLPDYDNDGVADTVDRCPTQIGNEAYNGCPHPENSVYRTRGQKETACKNMEVRGDTGTPVGTQQIYSQTIIAGQKIQVFPSTSRKITWLRIDPDLCDYSPIPTQSARIANVEETIKEKEEKVSIVEPAKVSTIAIAPNPVTNGQFTLQLNLEQASDVQITLYNFSGNRVQSIPSKLYGKGQHTIPVKVNRLRSGQYIVKVTTAEGIVSKHLIIK